MATILGIESSCDETAAAVVRDGRTVLSSAVATQIAKHRPYGGVVPELASRCHVEALEPVVAEALATAGIAWADIDAVAATRGPGLANALLIGWSAAQGLAAALGKPLVAVNHLCGHIHSVFLDPAAPDPRDALPLVALVASGGHTGLYFSKTFGEYELLGQTIDDAAGEALDKGAKLLGLGYPGGPEIQRAAEGLSPSLPRRFPVGRVGADSAIPPGLDPELCFSFSGLKTSLRQRVAAGGSVRVSATDAPAPDFRQLACDYQDAVVEAIARRCDLALRKKRAKFLAVGGGVSLNAMLRARLAALCRRRNVALLLAPPAYCGDNAAMIAGAAGTGLGTRGEEVAGLDVSPNWPL